MVQRYEFESKSQRHVTISEMDYCCFQWFKDMNLKANHNWNNDRHVCYLVVSNGSKI